MFWDGPVEVKVLLVAQKHAGLRVKVPYFHFRQKLSQQLGPGVVRVQLFVAWSRTWVLLRTSFRRLPASAKST